MLLNKDDRGKPCYVSKINSKFCINKTSVIAALFLVALLCVIAIHIFAKSTDTDILVHLSLDDSQTRSVATDSSGNSNNGKISGATYSTESIDGSTGSLNFNGIDESVVFEPLDVTGTGITLAAWIKADSFTGKARDSRIISKASGIMTNKHVFMLGTVKKGTTGDTVLRARVRVKGETATFRASGGVLETGVWYHTAMTYDDTTVRLYVDGLEVASSSFPEGQGGPVDVDSDINVAVGANPNGSHYFDGRIDDVIIAQRVFTAAELLAIADQGAVAVRPLQSLPN